MPLFHGVEASVKVVTLYEATVFRTAKSVKKLKIIYGAILGKILLGKGTTTAMKFTFLKKA